MFRLVLVSVLLAVGVSVTTASSDILRSITTNFLQVLNDCKLELNLTENILLDLYLFWKDDHALLSRDVGCTIICMSRKLNLLDDAGKLHHGNAREFAATHGADEQAASKLISVVHDCEKQNEHIEEACLRALDVAKCFRNGMRTLNWAPKMDVIVSEVLTDV